MIGATKEEIDTPALLVDLDVLEENLARMADLAANTGMRLRPHIKTHKTPLIAKRQMELGAAGVCCAKLGEAEVMVAGGISDVLVTTPIVTPDKIRRLAQLARQATIAVVVDDSQNVRALSAAAAAAQVTLHLVVEVNVGQQRCGVQPGAAAADLADEIVRLPGVQFRGLQGYHGSIQQMVDLDSRSREVRRALDLLLETAEIVRRHGHQVDVLTGGGTGSSLTDVALRGLTELQPGSYVFMDCTYRRIQWQQNSPAPPFQSALSVLTSVVSCAARDRVIVDAGWKSLSSDSGLPIVKDPEGAAFAFAGDEHGKISLPEAARISSGDKIEIVPSHCDTTVNLYDQYVCTRKGRVEAIWPIAARGRTQ